MIEAAEEVGESTSTTQRAPAFISLRMRSSAWCALRLGRKPYEQSRKLGSKIGSRTSLAAVCTTLSRTRGIPSGLRSCGFPGVGM
jgi:hypothetical protein